MAVERAGGRAVLLDRPVRGGPTDRSGLQAVDRAFAVLGLFSPARSEWTLSEVADGISLPLTTAHRLLGVLKHHGFLDRDPDSKRYRLGPTALEFGARARVSVDLRELARPALRRLAERTGETTLLTVADPGRRESLCLERIESASPLRLSVEPGRRMPLHAGAMQKGLLAFMPRAIIEAVVAGPLPPLCRSTITDGARLRAELTRIRAEGYAVSYEETNLGAWGLAVPILDRGGTSVAAVGSAGPIARYDRSRLEQEVAACREAAACLAADLGLHTWTRTVSEPAGGDPADR